jgi:hypothetical protein
MVAATSFRPVAALLGSVVLAVSSRRTRPTRPRPSRAEARARRGAEDPDPHAAPAQECVNHRDRLHAQTDDALKDKAQIEADKAEIGRLNTSLAEEVATIDRTSDVAVDAYNAKVDQRDKLIDTYQNRVTAYNAKAEQVKATKEATRSPARTGATTSAT